MTIGQSDIIRWIQTEIPNATTETIGDSIIRVTDQDGTQTDYSMSIFGDILKVELPIHARPKTWTKKEA